MKTFDMLEMPTAKAVLLSLLEIKEKMYLLNWLDNDCTTPNKLSSTIDKINADRHPNTTEDMKNIISNTLQILNKRIKKYETKARKTGYYDTSRNYSKDLSVNDFTYNENYHIGSKSYDEIMTPNVVYNILNFLFGNNENKQQGYYFSLYDFNNYLVRFETEKEMNDFAETYQMIGNAFYINKSYNIDDLYST